MPDNKKEDFIVTDKRKFTMEGEVRSGTEGEEARESERPQPQPSTPSAQTAPPSAAKEEVAPLPSGMPPVPPPPSAEEQQAQHDAYKQSGKQFEPSPLSGRTPRDFE